MLWSRVLCLTLCGCSTVAVEQQHALAIKRFTYVEDIYQYGVKDAWTPSLVGDCEDYALWLKERVGGTLWYVYTQDGQAHIVLNVNGKIVDNLSKVVYPASEMKHRFMFEITDEQLPRWLESRPVPKKE